MEIEAEWKKYEEDKAELARFKRLIEEQEKDAQAFCDEVGYCKDSTGRYIYKSPDGHCSMNLVSVLSSFQDWLSDKKIVRDIRTSE